MTICGQPTLEITLPYATLACAWLAVQMHSLMVTSAQPRAYGDREIVGAVGRHASSNTSQINKAG